MPAARQPLRERWVAQVAVVALLYFAVAKASLLLAISPGFASAVWPPSGIALAAMLLYGLRLWPGVWLAAFLVNLASGSPLLPALAIASGNTLEACAGCWLVQRFVGAEVEFRRPETVFRFAAAIAACALIAATFGVMALTIAGVVAPGERLINWYTWWQGDMAGMIVFTPFLLAWARPAPRVAERGPLTRWVEQAAFGSALLATFAMVAALTETYPAPARTLFFLLIPFVAWAGCRYTERVVTATVLALTAMTLWFSLTSRPLMLAGSIGERLLVLQAFVATIAVMGLALCALSRQRREAEARLKGASEQLEAAVHLRTQELAHKNRELAHELAQRLRLSAALEQRESQLAEAQAITHIGSWNWEVASDRFTWSDELMRIFAVSAQDAGIRLSDYLARFHDDDREQARMALQRAQSEQRSWESVERIVRGDGTVRQLKTTGRIWIYAGGTVGAIYAACTDVTDSIRRERVQEVQHEIAGILVRASGWPQAITESLQVVCERLGWALGQMWRVDAEHDLIRLLHVWARPGCSEFVESSKVLAFGKGQGLPGLVWQGAAPEWVDDYSQDPTRSRARRAAECGLHAAFCFPLLASGRVLGVIEFFASERRSAQSDLLDAAEALGRQLGEYVVRSEAETLLRESEERLRLLIEGVKEYAIVMLDPQGGVATWNSGAARISGYAAEEILGQSCARFHPQEDRARRRPEALLKRALLRGVVQDEGWRVRKDGSRFWANEIITALYGADGGLRGYASVTRDMTAHKQVEALEEAGRQTRQFLAMLGHELRNPLAPIRNAVGVMRLREIADPHVRYCRDLIERQVQHLARLVDDLLDASRITTGMIGLKPEPLDLREVIDLALETVQPAMDSRKHQLGVERSVEPLPIMGDRTRLVQVLQNLLGNAAKYTPDGGTIELRAQRAGELAMVEVRDDGMGIAPELLPRIFELFMQGDGSLARTEGGLGVGLALARRIAELHGGSIQAFSEGVGRGATFVLRLPLAQEQLDSPPSTPPRAGSEHAQATFMVLIVDDNRDAADSMAALLEMRGHRVAVAYDGPSALDAARRHAPEVVLLDIGLPGMDGYEVGERLRSMEQTRASLIVALTGYGQAEDRQRSVQSHLDGHLVKPIDYQTLCAVIERAAVRNEPAQRTS
jgi:PAS domain S-box-containing protein